MEPELGTVSVLDKTKLTTGKLVREACRAGELTGQTAGLARGYTQANLLIVPQDYAFEFLLYAQRNPKPCPVLEVVEAGDIRPRLFAPDADLRTDFPRYRVWKNGELVEEPTQVSGHWRDDLVSFVIGCSFTFENALLAASVPVRHIEENVNVPMYRTDVACRSAGRFSGPMVVSMRPLTPDEASALDAALEAAQAAVAG
jgi:uncharacterized protein YcsI (UPF0317 family)